MELNGQLQASAALPAWKYSGYILDRRLGGRMRQSGDGDEEKESCPLSGIEPRSSSQ
jgi:hypothetical protein